MEASFFSLLSKTPSQLFRNFQALILLISILLLLWPSSSSLSVAAAAAAVNLEAEALLTWKATLQNQHQFNYHPLSSWSAQTSPCAWFGIFCNNQGSIANITLVGTGLKATLEVFSFSSFPNLVSLNLQNNSLYGPIPSHIANLSKLSFLDLSLNGFYGSIPSEIGSLVRLSSLSFTSNNLNGSIPTSFANLTQLLSLGLDRNQLSGYIPQEIGKLASLTTLDFTLNKITGPIQAGIGNLTNLSILRLGWNNLYGPIPEELGLLRGLVKLDLSTNNLTGEIPAYLGNLTLLDNLFLSSNKLSGNIPSELGKLTSLSDFQLYTNRLTGPIPPSIGNLSRLNMLAFSGNQLSGSIPEEIGMMRSLIVINLNTNVLTGSIPASIANIPNISYIGFAGNRLSGIVPVEIGDLKALMSLDLSHNFLTADIPREIGGLLFLETLNLSHNSFVGSIPPGLANVLSLRDVNVSYNQLEGPIPDMESFRRAPFEALRNNRDLCGNNSVLNPCPLENPTAKAGKQSDASIIVFPILGGGILLISLATRRIKARKASTGNEYLQVFAIWTDEAALTYESIIQATESFDSRHQIGSGSSGSVYKAALQSTTKQNQVVAVKKLHDQSGEGVERLKANWRAFRSEIRALTNIKHRNIVKLYGFFSNAQHSLLVYEFMERGSLRSVLDDAEKAKELDWEDRVKIVKGIASALSYMHHDCRPPIVHRDISSNNVLLDLDFEAKLSDFGTARLLRPDDRVSTTSFAAGTYGYMAPERAYSKKVDEKWDVYGFGVVALEVIIGKHPGDLISSLTTSPPHPTLLKDIIDDRITQPGEDGEVAKGVFAIAKFALACVRAEPSSRPTMQEVTMDMVTFAIPPLTQPFSQVSLEELFALVD
ncbi:unnamed protein product [Linum tenue]|uniref:non-specific serine/threonine protein kinase n=1 Tax=Linum tenue TaxID=586396 RepID=A0AAV0QT52_9ROSI|nr:unnamed protein product [Linum tenue]